MTELGINSSVSTTCMYYLKHIKHKSSIIFIFHVLSLRTMKTQSRGVPWGTSRHPQMCLKTFSIHGEDFHYFHMARISNIFNAHAEYLQFCRENVLKFSFSLVPTHILCSHIYLYCCTWHVVWHRNTMRLFRFENVLFVRLE